MGKSRETSRRVFLCTAVSAGSGLFLAGCGVGGAGSGESAGGEHAEEVTPAEDLMREHGVLKRVLMIYEEAQRRLVGGRDLSPQAVADAARLIREFIENYHEVLEEKYVFPRLARAGVHIDLVKVLMAQHQAGRRLTDVMLQLATPEAMKDEEDRRELAGILGRYVRMYSPHEAREDTVLFPALRRIVSDNEYDAMGEDFERRERELIGQDGFARMVERVANIEQLLGIYDLAQFTPSV